MISYPGDVLARFGRYEAVEDDGPRGRAHLWRAWDPFVERFVVVAVLEDVTPAEVVRGWRQFDAALTEWTGGYATSVDAVLDLAPPGAGPAFLVLRLAPDPRDRIQNGVPTASAGGGGPGPMAAAGGAVASGWGRLVLGGLGLLLAGALAWLVVDGR